MTLGSRLAGRLLDLPPALTREVTVTRNIRVPARDGIALATDHYAPALTGAPTVLIRSPYGRAGLIGLTTGRVLAERGFHVVLQSCRGTFGSGGEFRPLRHEREDGLDTIAWIERQPWYDGTLFTYGPSYVGFTQWAVADSPAVKGMLTAVTASSFRDPTYAGGAFSLDTILNWATLIGNQGGSMAGFLVKQYRSQSRLRRAFAHWPLSDVDALATGAAIEFFQEWLGAAQDEAYWADRGHEALVRAGTPPICMVGGWYDIFLPWQLADYARLRAAGARPRLVIGDWNHTSRELFSRSVREGVTFFSAQANGGYHGPAVELYVGGANEWRQFEEWPPEPDLIERWYLGPGRTLAPELPNVSGYSDGAAPDRFRYDPADPTPSPGGPLLTTDAGRVDNTAVERRDDILLYTSAPLDADVEAIGPVRASIALSSTSPYFDVHVRLCEVMPDGRSENICDGLTRVTGGAERVEVELWPTAYRWRAGRRLRIQVAGGAHPRYARNPGTGEPLGTGTELRPVEHEVYLDRDRPSWIELPRSRT